MGRVLGRCRPGTRGRSASPRPRAFTLIELLVVIVIIGILAALLVPAVGGAMRTARNAAVTTEAGRLAQTLMDFAGKYGGYPPSRILLVENGDYSASNFNFTGYTYASPSSMDSATGMLVERSLAHLRKFFPNLQISSSGPTRGPGTFAYTHGDTSWFDFNGNGKLDPPILLTGDECLVYFLGGIAQVSAAGGKSAYNMSGFAAKNNNPFQGYAAASNRTQPLYEFDGGRLKDFDNDGFPSYCDSLKTDRPFVYFSAYNGTGYDPNDVNFDAGNPLVESDEALTTTPITLAFRVNFPVKGGGFAVSPPPNPYTITPTTAPPVVWYKPNTFQILSPGADGLYGLGGVFTPDAKDVLPVDTANSTPSGDVTIRSREKDNLTSFHGTRLD